MHTGTISQGTLRPQDLIPTFLTALADYDSAAYEQLVAQPHPPIPAYVQDEGDDSEWWHSEEAAFLQEELINALENAAPDAPHRLHMRHDLSIEKCENREYPSEKEGKLGPINMPELERHS